LRSGGGETNSSREEHNGSFWQPWPKRCRGRGKKTARGTNLRGGSPYALAKGPRKGLSSTGENRGGQNVHAPNWGELKKK